MMTNLQKAITESFSQILTDNSTEVKNTKSNKVFNALVTSADYMASFDMDDQDTTEAIQGTCFIEDAPKTGDILLINEKKYITQTVQSRVNGPIIKFTANLR